VSQILDLAVLDERFSRSEFDLAGYWNDYLVDFHARLYRGKATVRLSAAGRRCLGELMSAAVIEAAEQTSTVPDQDGWVRAVVPIESLEHAHTEFLKLGAEVEVLAPHELRERLEATVRAMAAIYLSA
jgi:predicted DNA-binding transcriptional regulator YafY